MSFPCQFLYRTRVKALTYLTSVEKNVIKIVVE